MQHNITFRTVSCERESIVKDSTDTRTEDVLIPTLEIWTDKHIQWAVPCLYTKTHAEGARGRVKMWHDIQRQSVCCYSLMQNHTQFGNVKYYVYSHQKPINVLKCSGALLMVLWRLYSSVQSLTKWVLRGTWGTIQQRSFSSFLSAGGPCEQFGAEWRSLPIKVLIDLLFHYTPTIYHHAT